MSEQDYLRGVAIAEAKFGDETRPFDRAIWGINECLAAAGRPNDAMAVANRWHNPLASATKDCTLGRWLKAFPAIASYYVKEDHGPHELRFMIEGRTAWRWMNVEQAACVLESDETVDRQATDLLDREIKRAYPKVRRNTKRYRELADSKREQAREIIREQLRADYQTKLASLEQWHKSEETRDIETVTRYVDGMRTAALDLLALNPLCEIAPKIMERAERIAENEERLAGLRAVA